MKIYFVKMEEMILMYLSFIHMKEKNGLILIDGL